MNVPKMTHSEAARRALADARQQLLEDPEAVADMLEDIRKSQPFIDDLRSIGLDVVSIFEIIADDRIMDKRIVPIIADHLQRGYDWGIIFYLTGILQRFKAGKGASAVPALINIFAGEGYVIHRWEIGSTIFFICNDSNFEEIKPLILNKSYGKDREMLVFGLYKMKRTPGVVDFLISLLDDEDTYGHAIAALYKLQAIKAKPYFERFKNDKKIFVRNYAKKALAIIEKLEAGG